jgi:tetratricopeptide (TPR) repeat protein
MNPSRRRTDWPGLVSGAVLAAGTLAIYRRTFGVPLLLDDGDSIARNLSIRHLWPLWPLFSPPNGAGVGGRPLCNLSFALNYAAGGTAVAGYHAVNLLIHVLAAWVLFALVRRTLRQPVLAERFGPAATPLALAISALWAWHPVITESVTYISQRGESQMGLFYLLTVYGFARYAAAGASPGRKKWAGLAILACLFGVGTKEVIVTAPLLVLLYDRTFVSGGFVIAWRRHRALYLGLAATWLPLAGLLTSLHLRGAGTGLAVPWWDYATTECRVVIRYLQLAIWPSPLVFDYGMYVRTTLSAVWPYALILVLLLAATLVALRRSPPAGFAAAWFFVILGPSSSVIAVIGQPMAENRLYLPLAGLVSLAVLGGFALAGRRSYPVIAAVALALGLAAARRNDDYRSEASLWSDTVAKVPANARAHNNLGDVWSKLPGRMNDAVAEYEAALRLQPDFPTARNNLGNAWAGMPGHLAEAIAQYQEVLRRHPDNSDAHNNLGSAWSQQPGRLADAIAEFQTALRLNPANPEALYNLGRAWAKTPGRLADAIAEDEAALRLRPEYAEAHNDLGLAWSQLPGKSAAAAAEYEEALRLKPELAAAHNNLGNAWMNQPGRQAEAIAQYQEAVRLQPDDPQLHTDLGLAWLAQPGHSAEAIAEFEKALRLRPDFPAAQASIGNVLLRTPGRTGDAISHYEAALRAEPDNAEVHSNLGYAFVTLGRLPEAVAQEEAALRLQPNLVLAHLNLAVALLGMPGGLAAAQAHLQTVLRIQPGNAPARQILDRIRSAPP